MTRTKRKRTGISHSQIDWPRLRFIKNGRPAEKLAAKPNFVELGPGATPRVGSGGTTSSFVSQPTDEKCARHLPAAGERV